MLSTELVKLEQFKFNVRLIDDQTSHILEFDLSKFPFCDIIEAQLNYLPHVDKLELIRAYKKIEFKEENYG